ncbi:hypothetical protein BKP35_00490 [Anaerobacillus arseniciselenatis]|uniref:Phenylalanyl-tRNA synthetase subunit beta n=1 Tax=Anaerobacillus arseniciselenatis TaxID=85682 RepID=A0A1S2LV30_9BACI|nr:hypothetical protein [Anaerobacillus arseniciselenatis]OIJ15507.1 hypothetical protein BKP35_00490 [Anaerobacillus arseniciselenatis]
MKKIILSLIILGFISVAGYYGYNHAISYTSDQMIEHVVNDLLDEQIVEQLLSDPKIEELVQELVSQESKKTSSEKLEELPFTTKEEGVKVVLSKFSIGEITAIASQAQSGLTVEQQMEIADQFTERLTEEEIEALMIIGVAELMKEFNNR